MGAERLGGLLLALGCIGVLRLVPEVLQLRGVQPIYWWIVGMDLVLALSLMGAGAGLRRGSGWAARAALSSAGPLLITSIGWGIILGSEVGTAYLNGWTSSNNRVLISRLAFYVLAVALCPYASWRILGASPAESRRSLRIVFGSSLAAGAVVMGAFYLSL
jgi:hypothetical protein